MGKTTKNKPESSKYSSSLAVDGIFKTKSTNHSCTQTTCCKIKPWWRVDFGSTALVYALNITRIEDCCEVRVSDFNVRVGDSDVGRGQHNALCQQNIAVAPLKSAVFICNPPMYGRYLYIQTNVKKKLSLCEVEVYGEISMKES